MTLPFGYDPAKAALLAKKRRPYTHAQLASPTAPQYLTPEQAKEQYGVTVLPGRLLKVSSSSTSPSGLEGLQIYGDPNGTYWEPSTEGITQLDKAYKKTGVVKTWAQIDQQQKDWESSPQVYDYSTGQFVHVTPESYAEREEYYRQARAQGYNIAPPGTPGAGTFSPRVVTTQVSPEVPITPAGNEFANVYSQEQLDTIHRAALVNPQNFVSGLQGMGKTPQTVTLLKGLGASDIDIEDFFGNQPGVQLKGIQWGPQAGRLQEVRNLPPEVPPEQVPPTMPPVEPGVPNPITGRVSTRARYVAPIGAEQVIATSEGQNVGRFIAQWMTDRGLNPTPPDYQRLQTLADWNAKDVWESNASQALAEYQQRFGVGARLRFTGGQLASLVLGQAGKIIAPGETLTVGGAIEGAVNAALLVAPFAPAIKTVAVRTYREAFYKGLEMALKEQGETMPVDKWVAYQANLPSEMRSPLGEAMADKNWVVQRSQDNLKARLAELAAGRAGDQAAVEAATKAAAQDTMSDIQRIAQAIMGKAKEFAAGETGAIGQFHPESMPFAERSKFVRAIEETGGDVLVLHDPDMPSAPYRVITSDGVDLGGASDWKTAELLLDSYRKGKELKPTGPDILAEKMIPKAAEGMPEAGLQSSMIPSEVNPKEVFPEGKGKVVQVTMDDQLQLHKVEVSQAKAEIEGLQQVIQEDAKLQKLYPMWQRMQRRKDANPAVTIKEWQEFAGKSGQPYPRDLMPDGKHVKWEYALDSVASEYGYPGVDELMTALDRYGANKAKIKELQGIISAPPPLEKPVVPSPSVKPSASLGLKEPQGVVQPLTTSETPPVPTKGEVPTVEATKPTGGELGRTIETQPTGQVPPIKPPEVTTGVAAAPEPKPTPIQNVKDFYKAKIADIKAATSDKIVSLQDWQKYTVAEKTRVMDEIIAANKGASEDKIASLKDWQKQSVEEQTKTVQDYYKAKIEDLKNVNADKIASLKDWANYRVEEQDRVKNILTDYIKEQLPLSERGKLIDAVKNVKNQTGLDDVLARVDTIAEKTLRSQIEKQLSRAETRQVQGMPKGKYTAEVQKQLEGITHYLMDNDAAILKSLSTEDLQKALVRIKELRGEGRIAHVEKELARQAEMEMYRTNIIKDTTGGKGIKPGAGTISAKSLEQNTRISARVAHAQLGWDATLNSLDKMSGAAPHEGNNSWLGRYATRANEVENVGRSKQLDSVRENFSRIFGVTKPKDINKRLRQMNEKVDLGTFKNADGVEVSFKDVTKGQIIKKYQEMQDPTLQRTFDEGMKWTPEIRKAFNDALTPAEKAWADYQMQFLRDYYPSVNEVYSRINNVDLPNNQFYTPIARDKEVEVAYNLLDPADMMKYAGVHPGSLKSRVANIHPLKFTNANQTLLKHIIDMEHYKAWAEPIRDLRSVYGNPEVRNAIVQYHGKDMLDIIDGFLNDFARGGIDQGHTVRILDQLRTNFATAVIGLKPNIAIQQLPTVFGYLAEMSPRDFAVGVADFWKHPVENYKFMMNESPYIKARYQQGFERDIAAALHSDTLRELTGKANVRDAAFALMTSGDKFGVLQGWWAKYKLGLKRGLSKIDAMEEANFATDRTQNTASIDTLSSLQRGGSFWKLLTLFQTQPNKYFRIMFENAENLKYGRGNKADAIKAIVIAWAVLPAIYQYIADGFQFKKEHMGRAVVLGPVNDLLIAGQVAQWLSGRIFGENFDYNATPILGGLNDVGKAIQNGAALNRKRVDPYKDISWNDIINFIELTAKGGGEVSGIPTPWLIQAEKALRGNAAGKRDLRQLIMSQWALEPPAPSLKDKARIAIAGDEDNPGLGMVIPTKPGKEKTEEPPTKPSPVKDMKKLDTEFGNIFSATLPSDIGKDYDPIAQLWAKKEASRANSNVLPNIPLSQINTDPTKSPYYTIDDYVKQWQARSGITSLEKLKEYDDFYRQAFLGNVNRTQLDLLHRWALISPDDKVGQAQFKKDNPGITVDLRQVYLKTRPEENAYQAIFGDATIYSSAAYDKMLALAKEYDIPANALPKFKDIPTDSNLRKAYFDWKEVADEFDTDSPEAHLILAKNADLQKFINPNAKVMPDSYGGTPVPALKIQVNDREYLDKIAAATSEDAKTLLRQQNPTEAANEKKVDAYKFVYRKDNTIADSKMVDAYAEYKGPSDEEKPTTNEDRLYRVTHKDFDDWGQKYLPTKWKSITDPTNSNYVKSVDALRLKIEIAPQEAIVKNLPDKQARDQYLADLKNADFVRKRIEIDGLDAGVSKTDLPLYVQIAQTPAGAPEGSLPGAISQSRERLLKVNRDYYDRVAGPNGILAGPKVDFDKVVSKDFEDFYNKVYLAKATEKEKDLLRAETPWFEQEGLVTDKFKTPVGVKSIPALKLSIANQIEDKVYNALNKGDQIDYLANPIHHNYAVSRVKIEGLNKGVPENRIDLYVEFQSIPEKGYGRARFLLKHYNDYYLPVYKHILRETPMDFRQDAIPSLVIESQLNEYNDLRGARKTAYLRTHSVLRLWMERHAKLRPSQANDFLGTTQPVGVGPTGSP